MAEHGSTSSPFQRRYPPELRERAVRMVFETASERGERFGAVTRVAGQLGIGPESLRKWVHQAEVDGGKRTGLTTEERARMKELERDNRELRRANEILKAAAVSSVGRRNSLGQHSRRCAVVEGLARSGVQSRGDGIEVGLAVPGEVRLLREVLAQEPVGVLV
jgi:transposase